MPAKQATSAKKGGKGRKIGRHKRAPSNAGQQFRSDRNKRKRIERAAAEVLHYREKPVEHGKARRKRRAAMVFSKPAKATDKNILAEKFPDFYAASKAAGVLPGFSVLGELVSAVKEKAKGKKG